MPNDLGAYLVIVVPIAMGYFIAVWRTRRNGNWEVPLRWVWIVSLGFILCVMVANLALTLTRGAWISVCIAMICMVICFKRRLLWGLLIFVVLSPILMPHDVKDRFESIWQRPSGFMSERPQWWQTSTQLIAKYPITGIGLGRFRHEYKLHGPPDMYHEPYHAHNIYLQIAVEHGIPSLLLFYVEASSYLSPTLRPAQNRRFLAIWLVHRMQRFPDFCPGLWARRSYPAPKTAPNVLVY